MTLNPQNEMEATEEIEHIDQTLNELFEKNKEKERLFGEEKIGKLIFKFSMPAIIGMLISAVYNIVDTIFIGHKVGEIGTAALNFCFPLNIISLGALLLFGAGGSALYSIRMGQKRYEDATKVLGNALLGAMLLMAVIMPLSMTFMKPLLRLFGATDDALPLAYSYMIIVAGGLPLFAISVWGNNFMRATGRPMLSMVAMLIGGVVNLILDPIFIFAFDMGMEGAAIATIIGQGCSAAWMIVHFCSPKAKIRLQLKSLIPSPKVLLSIMKYGVPFFVYQSAMSAVQLVINYTVIRYAPQGMDNQAIAAMGVVQKFQTIIYMPIAGLAQGITPIMAYNYGAKKVQRSNSILLRSMTIASLVGVLGFVAAQAFPSAIMRAFVSGATSDFYVMGVKIMRAWTLGYPIYAYILASNYFTATAKPIYSAFLAILRQVILFIPAIILLPLWWGFDALFYANAFSDGVMLFVVGISLLISIKKINNTIRQTKDPQTQNLIEGVLNPAAIGDEDVALKTAVAQAAHPPTDPT